MSFFIFYFFCYYKVHFDALFVASIVNILIFALYNALKCTL
jgi:hypothetical protein